MTALTTLPVGTIIRLIGSERGGLTMERTDEDLWAEVFYHCVDCVEEYNNEEMQALVDAAALDGEPFEVRHVPADWLTVRLTLLLANATTDVPDAMLDAIRELAIDAGLSDAPAPQRPTFTDADNMVHVTMSPTPPTRCNCGEPIHDGSWWVQT